ncbi:MAG: HD domain-containing protein [Negativicutes bacterium]|nr:HD domain-containing protein [Negativicutes bacterium]
MIAIPVCDEEISGWSQRESFAAVSLYLDLLQLKSLSLRQHSDQVANYAVSCAAVMGLPPEEILRIKVAARLHDIGHLATDNLILGKLPFLTTRELSQYKNHSRAGASMLESIPECADITPYIKHHHERWDGQGFPSRLKGINIPIGARIIAVADYYDRYINPAALNWRKKKSEAVAELRNQSGSRFDSAVVSAFIKSLGRH